MAFKEIKQKTVEYRDRQLAAPSLATKSDTVTSTRTVDTGNFYELESAEVVDIILDQFHPEFNDWSDIGKIKARLIHSEVNRNIDSLQWIKPLNNGFKKYPLLHEIVIVGEYTSERSNENASVREKYYMMPPLNVFNSVQENAIPNVSIDSLRTVDKADSANQVDNYQESETGANVEQTFDEDVEEKATEENPNGDNLGNSFIPNYDVSPLLPFEGDTIIEGRFGQTIRMGSTIKFNEDSANIPGGGHQPNWWSEEGINGEPILIIRNGQAQSENETEIDELAIEDIDKDGASIYLTAGQTIHFTPACDNMVTWQKTQPYTMYNEKGEKDKGLKTLQMEKYPFNGNQIIMSSDRIVMNARENEFMVYANGDIGFSTNGDFHINCRALRINAQEQHTMTAPKEGEADAKKSEPAVLGDQLLEYITGIVDRILELRYPGAPGVVDSTSAIKLKRFIKTESKKILSKQTYIKKEKDKVKK